MQLVNRILLIFLLSVCVFFLQQGGFLRIGGTTPNLILLLFLLYIFIGVPRVTLFFSGVLFIILALIWVPFWLPEIAILLFTLLLVILFRHFFTGNPNVDFFLSIMGGTFLFYILLFLFNISLFSFGSIIRELMYSLVIGVCMWIGARRLRVQAHNIK